MKPHRPFRIQAVLFDFDGTLTKPGALDFVAIKHAIGCPLDRAILEYIDRLEDPQFQKDAFKRLVQFELAAAEKSVPNAGSEEIVAYLRSKGLGVGIISRNGRQSIERALQNFNYLSVIDFDVIISRDDPVEPKPSPDGLLLAAENLHVDVDRLLMVGDYIFDIQAGRSAGAVTVLLYNGPKPVAAIPESDYTISHLAELKKIVRLGLPLLPGKLPNELLTEFLEDVVSQDPSVLIKPGVGEDGAAVDVNKEEVIILKSDPITFVAGSIGHYAVLINANDVATAGARPRWMLTSLLFPPGTTPSAIWKVMYDLQHVCRNRGISVCGGHTEITDAVNRPVVTGTLVGTVRKRNLVDKRNIRPGDVILLTKAVAVEGTAIIAGEFGDRLLQLGLTESEIETCRQFLANISVLEEAEVASRFGGVSAMHDVTEGGLSTALLELSEAGKHRISIDVDKIPVYPETRNLCRLFNLDPLGLIGSGSLLICCRKNVAGRLQNRIRLKGIAVTHIGNVLSKGRGVNAMRQGVPVEWPRFEVDEITRL